MLALLPGCAGVAPTGADRTGCATDFHPGTDYFPDKSTVSDAANFTLSYHDSYQVLAVTQPSPQSYVLVRCGTPTPPLTGELADAQPITVPVTSLHSTSVTQRGMIAQLNRGGLVVGNPNAVIDAESIIVENPGVLLSSGYDDPAFPRLRDAGIPVVTDAEWLEPTPLGRAEWIKVIAALTGTEKRAAQVFGAVRAAYRDLAARTEPAAAVQVLAGELYQGSWSMPGGASYAGRLIGDAGGSYPWAADPHSGSLQLNFESVYARSGQAPVWLSTAGWRTLEQVLAADSRYDELAAVRHGQVFTAGPDYWERGAGRPDLLLADLIAILHPDLRPGHRLAFYHRITPG